MDGTSMPSSLARIKLLAISKESIFFGFRRGFEEYVRVTGSKYAIPMSMKLFL